VIGHFQGFVDYVFDKVLNIELVSSSIGNEIDGYLGQQPESWQEYAGFFKQVPECACTKRYGLADWEQRYVSWSGF